MDLGLNWQTLIVLLLLAAAIFYVVRLVKRSWQGTATHGDCDGCDLPKKH